MRNLKFAAAGIAVCAGMLLTACSAGENVDYIQSTVTSDGKFTCELYGIGADFDTEIWTFYTDAEIASANGANSTSNADMAAAIKKIGGVQNMGAVQESGASMMMLVEDTNVTKLGNLTEEAYLEASKKLLEDQFAELIDNMNSKTTTVTVAGISHPALELSGEIYEIPYYGRYIFFKNGNLMAVLNINSFDKDEIDEVTAQFYSL